MTRNILELKRLEKKISISKIAKEANISYSTVYRIFNNIIDKPTVADLKKISATLNIDHKSVMIEYNYLDNDTEENTFKAPIIKWENLSYHIPFEHEKTIPVTNTDLAITTTQPYCFATQLPSSKYRPLLFKDSVIICNINQDIRANDLILYFIDKKTPFIGKAKIIKNNLFIHSLDNESTEQVINCSINNTIIYYKIHSIHYNN